MERGISFLGIFVMIFLAWLMSAHRWQVSLRIVVGGLALQMALAVVILKTAPGAAVFSAAGAATEKLLDYVDVGSEFVFGKEFRHHFFAFKVLPTIIFFSALMSVFYYWGIMQRLTHWVAVAMQWTLRTSGAESLAAAANIFLGQTESPLVVRPYVATMTQSELMALMVGGFASIAGGVLAAYVGMGVPAMHLLTASVMSAPASLLIAKVLQPEVDQPLTLGGVTVPVEQTAVNSLDALAQGAADGVKLAINVAGMLIVFLAAVALVNGVVGWAGGLLGQQWSLERAFALAFWPLARVMGIETADCGRVGELLGLKILANEFIAYQRLGEWLAADSPVKLSERTVIITTYALCGFSNFGSIGIQIGGIGPMAPSRQSDLARLGLRAMLGGTLSTCMTACVAGVLL